jgi:hypothetical protein
MRWMFRGLLGLGCVLLGLGQATAASLLVTNPSFESPALVNPGDFTTVNPPGWTLTGVGGVFKPAIGTSVNSVPDGSQVAYVGNATTLGANSSIFQDLGVAAVTGQTYQLSVDVGSRKEGIPAHYLVELTEGGVTLNSASGTISPGTGNFGVVTFNAVGITGGGDIGVRLSETGAGQSLFDVVAVSTVATVPEPATLTMLGIGVVGMAGYGWRRRQGAAA